MVSLSKLIPLTKKYESITTETKPFYVEKNHVQQENQRMNLLISDQKLIKCINETEQSPFSVETSTNAKESQNTMSN